MAKTLNTRIALKIDTLENWSNITTEGQGGRLVLKRGEVGFCEIPAENATATTAPTVLFKVGDGENEFQNLKWASALAADVHTWAKKSEEDFKTYVSELIAEAVAGGNINLEGYATDGELAAAKTELQGLITGVSDRVKTIEDDYTTEAEAEAIAEAAANVVLGTEADEATANTVFGAKAAAKAASEAAGRAQAKADENAGAINTINENISKLNDTFATDDEVAAVKEELQGAINAKVAQADYDVKVKALEDADVALGNRATALETRASELETASATHATKDELNQAVAGLKGTAEDTKDSETIVGAKKYTDQSIADFTAAYITADGDAIDKLQEVASWIVDDEAGAAKVIADVETLKTDKLDKTTFDAFKADEFTPVADKAHTHDNKALLDTYTQTEADLADAVAKKHAHAENMVEVTPEQVEAWDAKADQADFDEAVARVKAIEDDYLKAADEFIIDCGSSTKNIFE